MSLMVEESFAESLAAAQAGDGLAFRALFRLAQPSVLRYLRGVSRDRAQDLAGETWLRGVRGLGTFSGDEPAAVPAWVLSVARRGGVEGEGARTRRPETVTDRVPEQLARHDVADAVE